MNASVPAVSDRAEDDATVLSLARLGIAAREGVALYSLVLVLLKLFVLSLAVDVTINKEESTYSKHDQHSLSPNLRIPVVVIVVVPSDTHSRSAAVNEV